VVLANQFVAELLPEIKSKVVGDFDHLLTKIKFEEAKLHDLGSVQLASPSLSVSQGVCSSHNLTFVPRQQHMGSTKFNMGPQCYNCGSNFHLIRQCPYLLKGIFKHAETLEKNNSSFGNVSVDEKNKGDNNTVSNITPLSKNLNSKMLAF